MSSLKLLPFFLFFLSASVALSQENNLFTTYQSVYNSSPEAAVMSKFVEVPVNYYNGIPDINIPIYQVQEGDISVPLILRYHSGGIKVAEEASWVGLGWDLTVGGKINHIVNNKNDLSSGGYPRTDVPLPFEFLPYGNVLSFNNAHNYYVQGSPTDEGCKINGSNYTYDLASAISMDGEPDLFIYNFGRHSGKFVFTGFNSGYSLSQDNIRLSMQDGGIQAITDDGLIYNFQEPESSARRFIPDGGNMAQFTYQPKTAYSLTEINSPKGKIVEFIYPPGPAEGTLISPGEGVITTNFSFRKELHQYQPSPPPSLWEQSFNESYYSLIDTIKFSLGYVVFLKSSRSDLWNGQKLDEIKVFNNTDELIKQFKFNYSYFEADPRFGDQAGQHSGITLKNNGFIEDYRRLRLKLISLDEVNLSGEKISYSFRYDETPLPYKTSFASDFWGFFNGQMNNNTLLPSGTDLGAYYIVPDAFNYFVGANRRPNESSIKAGILNEITYPTGGSVEFEYSANEFYQSSNLPTHKTSSALCFNPDPNQDSLRYQYLQTFNVPISDTFTISTQEVQVYYKLAATHTFNYPNCFNGENNDNCMWVAIERKNGDSWSQVHKFYHSGPDILITQEVELELQSGTYRVNAHYPDNEYGDFIYGTNEDYAQIRITYLSTDTQLNAVLGGGVKIDKIKHFDPVRNNSFTQVFTYTGGTMLSLPVHTSSRSFSYANTACGGIFDGCCPDITCTSIGGNQIDVLYSDSQVRYTYSSDGSPVGYRNVKVEMLGDSTGMSEYGFQVTAPTINFMYPGLPEINYLGNGQMLRKIDYKRENGDYIRVKELECKYDSYNKYLLWGFKTEARIPLIRCQENLTNFSCASCEQLHYYYYPIKLAHERMSEQKERFFMNEEILEKRSVYSYNTLGYLTHTAVTTSDGTNLTTDLKYPNDYNSQDWIQDMQERNMVNMPIETIHRKNGKAINGNFIEYKTLNGITFPYEIYALETNVPININSSSPSLSLHSSFKPRKISLFGEDGNLQWEQLNFNDTISYLWGYANSLPIAIAENAKPSDIAYSSFERMDTKGGWEYETSEISSSYAMTGNQSFIGNSIYKNNLTLDRYIITFWAKASTGDSGIITLGNKHINIPPGIWKYFEISTSSFVTSVNLELSAVHLDEIKLFPKSSRMTTFTHVPLVGITSKSTPDGGLTTYKFDSFKRLKLILDKDGNILKSFDYNYVNP
ncbi:hypothetical protein [Fulvivirga ligni]|uniref:hypothetical protein n=1 Tax=Fulvivirga ligni TaxID=2904246 RepID=UPI001F3DFC3A|nr:hypothetical protein [Fulvivirga ligni]UII21160.1 hypothetical protein LVD16_25320 [Fulvivirga ligni]